jgi:hypothetical protein
MKFHNLIVAAIVTGSIAGCANAPWITPPASNYKVVNTGSYKEPYDTVWKNIVGYLAQNQMQLKNVAKDSGVIYAEAVTFDDDVADCGSDTTMKTKGRLAKINIFVNSVGKNRVVSVNTEFKESRQMMTASDTVTCNSKGVMESRILSAAAGPKS